MSSTSMVARFRHWFEQECDAMDRTLASLESVPAEGRKSEDFRRAVSILSHVVVARKIWLDRFRGTSPASRTMFPGDQNLEQLAADWIATRNHWESYLEGLTEEGLAEDFAYHSTDGGHWHNSIEDTLVQLFTHSAYHRGQV